MKTGTSERKAKEKEALKTLILNAAQKLFVEKGVEHTTIRNIANAISYSIGTVYVYYKDKNDILHALHSQGFIQLANEMKVVYQNVLNPMERLKALGRVYLRFALENPEMYNLMFTMKAPIEYLESENKAHWREGMGAFDVLRQTVQTCIDAGHFKGHALDALAFANWSMVHGMATLHISNRIKGVHLANPATILFEGYEAYLMILDKA